jgi:hypothetical protein
MRRLFALLLLLGTFGTARADFLLVPMDEHQNNHLKAYGLAYWVLRADGEIEWLLNYRSGSFLIPYTSKTEAECRIRDVSYERLPPATAERIRQQMADPDVNQNVVKLHKAAKIAVYSPIKISPAEFEQNDAVILVLNYAEIPYEIVYDEEILKGDLLQIDWLHLHHEDFTGQFGRNLRRMSARDLEAQRAIAQKYQFAKVSQMKLAVAQKIKEFCAGGGYLFAMCSGAETLDIALAAEGVDIVDSEFDGDGVDPQAQSKLDFDKTLAFHNFALEPDNGYRGIAFSDINSTAGQGWGASLGYFQLFNFSAKWDLIPSMLTQNHESTIREFFGQTTAFRRAAVKPHVLVMGRSESSDRYIYGELGRGQWTFYGGHDPEGVRGGPRMNTDLSLHTHSPGYRLILNNILFPSARKKKRKT